MSDPTRERAMLMRPSPVRCSSATIFFVRGSMRNKSLSPVTSQICFASAATCVTALTLRVETGNWPMTLPVRASMRRIVPRVSGPAHSDRPSNAMLPATSTGMAILVTRRVAASSR